MRKREEDMKVPRPRGKIKKEREGGGRKTRIGEMKRKGERDTEKVVAQDH